jgi:fatty-acyl-CoA synthase
MSAANLTLRPFFWRATELFPEKEVVARTHDGTARYTYGDVGRRVHALAAALSDLGVETGDRVGTVAWNDHRHLEAYFAVPLMGAQLHTINLQLPDDHVRYIVDDAADEVLLVDPSALETIERLWDDVESVSAVVVMGESVPETDLPKAYAYEKLLAENEGTDFGWPPLDEDQLAGMCYTSGTTGKPKGVEYTHKMYYCHAMMVTTPAALNISERDVVMPVVPMFHVNAWELPYASTMAGAKQVHPGPSPDAADLVRLIEEEDVTLTTGVPTVWLNVLDYLDEHDADVSSLERIVVGGSAAPEAMMRRYEEEYGVTVDHAWGMTETMSIGSVSRPKSWMSDWGQDERFEKRKRQGLLSPGLEMRVVDDDGEEVAWDGEQLGELQLRGPTVASEYYNRPEANEEDFVEGWLKTGDIVSVDPDGYVEVVDRTKDIIKSGGEWISSIELENALMAHDDVVEAAVVATDDDRWGERPLAYVVGRDGATVTPEELRDLLAAEFPKWWLPDEVEFVDEIPKTATGKFDKKTLREEF